MGREFPDIRQATQVCASSLLKHGTASLDSSPLQKQAASSPQPGQEPGGRKAREDSKAGEWHHRGPPVACSPVSSRGPRCVCVSLYVLRCVLSTKEGSDDC